MTGTARKRGSGRAPKPRPEEKLQRWIDLLAALLVRHFGATFEQLARDVPAYEHSLLAGTPIESVKRTFERDKDELRAFGVPIESLEDETGSVARYRLRPRDFYLPFLALAAAQPSGANGRTFPVPPVTFEPDELAAIASGAARAQQLGDPSLAAAAASARRKLSVDLDIAVPEDEVKDLTPARGLHDAEVFERVSEAVTRRKELTFRYRSMDRDVTSDRRVQPWGLFYQGSAWYLVAFDLERQALRNFRLSRMSRPKVNEKQANTPDFTVPADFDLRQHARSAEAWELGDSDAVEVVVRFTGESGYVEAAKRLGAPVDGWREVGEKDVGGKEVGEKDVGETDVIPRERERPRDLLTTPLVAGHEVTKVGPSPAARDDNPPVMGPGSGGLVASHEVTKVGPSPSARDDSPSVIPRSASDEGPSPGGLVAGHEVRKVGPSPSARDDSPSVIPRSASDEGPGSGGLVASHEVTKVGPSPSARDDNVRVFRVRRQEVFARWLLTFAGEAVPVSPPEFVERFRALVRDTLSLYERP